MNLDVQVVMKQRRPSKYEGDSSKDWMEHVICMLKGLSLIPSTMLPLVTASLGLPMELSAQLAEYL